MNNRNDAPSGRQLSRRRQIAIGAAGVTALLGAGAYVVTARVTDHADTASNRAPAPAVDAAPSELSSGAADSVPGGPSAATSMSVEDRIKAARSAAARDGHPVQRALTTAPGVKPAIGMKEWNEPVENGTLRIVTAKSDLTGQGELLWPADEGKPFGDALCTQNFRFSNNAKPAIRPNLLVCWRTSAHRSVVTVLVDQSGKPSRAKSVGVIDREWAKLG
jgi:hypothetical protein